jgi:DNA ligase-1
MSSTGKIKTWSIEANKNTMIISSGYIDGKMNVQAKIIEGKNNGKSNETSDNEQCILECKSKWQKKIDEQYVEKLNEVKSYNEQEVLLPMLAQNYHDRKHDIKFPCYIQPKLNGARCIYQGSKFISRKGKEYTTLNHLVNELKLLGIKIPDGEIYVHGMTFQGILRRVKKDRGEETRELQYWIYDQVNDKRFFERSIELNSKFKSNMVKLVEVPTYMVTSEKEIKQWQDKWFKEGYEGAIVRNVNGLYKVKHRSKDLQKYKEFIDKEFIIVGAHEGSGEDAGTVIFEVKTKSGKIFSVRPKGTRKERREWLENIENIIGKELTVRYQNLSEEGIPIFPVGIAIRDYE